MSFKQYIILNYFPLILAGVALFGFSVYALYLCICGYGDYIMIRGMASIAGLIIGPALTALGIKCIKERINRWK